jgi:transcriptional regulator with XRE-family HTH domain
MSARLFPAILKYWRGRSGHSQLDLAIAANVSARHVAFLESGRAQPSAEMVLRLLSTLGVPLRDQNHALRAAGFEPHFAEPSLDDVAPAVDHALRRMMDQQEPYPLTVLSMGYDIVRANGAATRLFGHMMLAAPEPSEPLNLFSLVFDPRRLRPFLVDWEALARSMVARLHREALARRQDDRLFQLLDRVLAYPGVPQAWRQPDFATACSPTLTVRFARDDVELGFLTTVTVFSAPQEVTLDELRIESCFPLDRATELACARLARDSAPLR